MECSSAARKHAPATEAGARITDVGKRALRSGRSTAADLIEPAAADADVGAAIADGEGRAAPDVPVAAGATDDPAGAVLTTTTDAGPVVRAAVVALADAEPVDAAAAATTGLTFAAGLAGLAAGLAGGAAEATLADQPGRAAEAARPVDRAARLVQPAAGEVAPTGAAPVGAGQLDSR